MPVKLTAEARAWTTKLTSADELGDARSTAKAWTATISGLTGILAAIGLVKGREDITTLVGGYANAVYGLLTAALVSAVVAITVGAFASQGSLTILGARVGRSRRFWEWLAGLPAQTSYPVTWQGRRDFTHDEARIARVQLIWSRRFAVLASLLLIAGVSTTWYSPAAAGTSSTTVLVIKKDGSFVCGALGETGTSGSIVVSPDKGTKVVIKSADVLSLTAAESCP